MLLWRQGEDESIIKEGSARGTTFKISDTLVEL